MMNEPWTDDRLDRVIDTAAQRMTAGAPRAGLAARVAARLERRPTPLFAALRFAAAAALIAIVVFAGARLWRPQVPQPPAVPATTTSSSAPVGAPRAADQTAVTDLRQQPVTTTAQWSAATRITIDRRTNDIPPLQPPTALAVDAAEVSELSIAPLEVTELSVLPLEPGTETKPR